MAESDLKEETGSSTGGDGNLAGEDFPAGMKVLVVDDDQTCLKIISKQLCKCGYNVTPCREAKKALEILREKKDNFDLVLSDVQMPDMDGFKLLEHIGLELDLPVIMMTADLGMETVEKGLIHGACDFLPKPVTQDSLEYIWRHILSWKSTTNNDNNINTNNESESESESENESENENENASRSMKKRKEMTGEDDNEEDGSKRTVKKRKETTGEDDDEEENRNQDGSMKTVKKENEVSMD